MQPDEIGRFEVAIVSVIVYIYYAKLPLIYIYRQSE